MNSKALERRVKKHILAGKHTIFIPVIPGLEDTAIEELKTLNLQAEKEKEPGSLLVEGSMEDIWRIALLSRTASKLYLRLLSFKAEGFREFRNKTNSFPWELYLKEGSEYRIRFSLTHCRLHVTDNIGKSLNRSIKERFVEMKGRAPFLVEEKSSQVDASVQTILIRGVDNHFGISLDAGGGPLYDRGYRKNVTEAPLRETLAASLLLAAGICENTNIIDPMCGSGTFSLEAASITSGIPAGLKRTFPFEYWPSFRSARYKWLLNNQMKQIKMPCTLLSSDKEGDAIKAAKANWALLWQSIEEKSDTKDFHLPESPFKKLDFFQSSLTAEEEEQDTLLILNPPYGMRMELKDKLNFFRMIGKKINEDYKGVRWGIIAPGLDTEKAFALHWDKKILFKNGGLPVSFLIGKS